MSDSFFKNDDEDFGGSGIPGLNNAEDSGRKKGDIDKDRGVIAAVLSYIPFLCLIPLIQMRENEQARFHSRQGFVLFLIELLAVLFLIPGLSSLIWKTILVVALGASVAGIIFGLQDKNYKLPLIGEIAEKLKL
jgi:uncharacterized membrane protein